MIQTSFENKVQIQDILSNQVPEFIASENPKFTEFLKQYYISQEISGGNVDIVDNLPFYLKLDNFTSKVINGETELTQNVGTTVENGVTSEIFVADTEGFPKTYGLIQIGNEIITYKSKTATSFVDCVRNFSGIDEYGKNLKFSSSNIASHTSGTTVINLSVLFLKEFYSKIKSSLLPELDSVELYDDLDVNNFLKNTTSLYRSKGSKESFRILFKSLFNIEPQVVDLEEFVIKSSNADYRRRKELLVELISDGDPSKIVGYQFTKTNDPDVFGSISETEILTRDGRTFYKILLYLGFDEANDETTSVFTITPSTKLVDSVSASDSQDFLTVDSTIGFSESGSIFHGGKEIFYTEKTINQFLGCYTLTSNFIDVDLKKTDNLYSNDTYFAYEEGDVSKKVEFRLLGSLSSIKLDTTSNKTHINSVDENISASYFGKNIVNTGSNSRKEIIANSVIYNTSVRIELESVNFDGSTAIVNTNIDDAFLTIGDKVEVLKRNTEIVETGLSDVTIVSINNLTGVIVFDENFLSLNRLGKYDIRRKLKYGSTSEVPFEYSKFTSDVTNVYDEEGKFLYIASNSIPSYQITKNVVKSTVSTIEGFESLKESFTTLRFSSASSLIDGDRVYYDHSGENPINGLKKGEYYVTISNNRDIKVYRSKSSISANDFIYFNQGATSANENSIPEGSHTFTLLDQITDTNKISTAKALRKIPVDVDLSKLGDKVQAKPVGILINGVEVMSSVSDNRIYYGPIDRIDVINKGSGYDVINPPNLKIESGTAKIQPVLEGTIEKVYIDNTNFEVNDPVVTITGGNGKNALLKANTRTVSREVLFNAKPIDDGGGLSVVDETITFLSEHNFYSGQKVYYDQNDINNPKIGISTFGGSNVKTGLLNNNTPFYVKTINDKTIELYPTIGDYRSGINTVGFSTEGNFGIHKFKTEPKSVISSIVVDNPGEGFTNRKLTVKQSGISTINDTINFDRHGFSSGELITYDYETSAISGLSTTNQYYVLKIDDNSFRVCNAGVGGTDSSNYTRQKHVSIASSGVGYQYFNYPDIKVDITYLAGGLKTQANITCTPVVKGSIIDAYLYEEGADYGSTILNVEEVPKVLIEQGREASFTPILIGGKIDKVVVNYGGYDYYSSPELQVISSKGVGALLRPVIVSNKITDVIVIESGLGYSADDILIKPVFSGRDGFINPRIRSLSIDNAYKYGTQYLNGSRDPSYELVYKNINDELQYVVSGYSNLLKTEFNESDNSHSRIIGWAYDGNPIYGPFGYSDPEDSNSAIKRLVSGYTKSLNHVKNRPTNSEFVNGYFVDDYKFTNTGDLDVFNGRWCKTPDFPKGVYAYFATSTLNSNNENIGSFPYFVGPSYRSKVVKDNNDNNLNQSFDFKNSSLLRNTFPYKVQDKRATYDFFPSNKSVNNQSVQVTSVTKGSIDSYEIIKPGLNFKVGDSVEFENTEGSSGFGLLAEVKEIKGKEIESITNEYKKYTNSNVYTDGKLRSVIKILPSHDIKNNTKITVTGLTTDFESLNGEYVANVNRFTTRITEEIPNYIPNASPGTYDQAGVSGIVTDIKVESIPPRVSIGSSIVIKGASYDQHFTILNTFEDEKVLRCRKTGITGMSTAFSAVEYLPSTISLDDNISANDIENNYIRYFNPVQSIGFGTYSGVGVSKEFYVGTQSVTEVIPTQSIRIPNHRFTTGEKVILRRPSATSGSIAVKDDPGSATNFLLQSVLSEVLYVINKSDDYIGIVTAVGLTTTTNGLYFPTESNIGSFNFEYELETVYEEQLCTVYQNLTTVSISTSHNLNNEDLIELSVVPKLNTGIGDTTFADIKYIPEIGALSTKTIGFSTVTDINTSNNTITINNHLLNSGDRVYYISTSTPSGLSTDVYYVNKVDVDTIRLSETYLDATAKSPKIVSFNSVGLGTQEISIIESDIIVYKNNNLVFDVSDTSLENYKVKFFYDESFKNEFLTDSNTSSFSVGGIGTVGVSSEASLTLNYSDALPEVLYYSLTNSSSEVINSFYKSKITFKDSLYNGKYKVYDVEDTKFNIYLNDVPERLSYLPSDCKKIEYITNSKTGIGSVHSLKILDSGNSYDNIPYYSGTDSDSGSGLSVLVKSESIGKIQSYSQLTDGYEYSADRTISPSINSSANIILSNSNQLNSVTVVDGGKKYPSPPNIVIVDTDTGEEIDVGLLVANMSGSGVGNANIESITIAAPANGLPERPVTIKAVDNANGIRIDRVDSNAAGIMTCFLKTPIIGYTDDPFEIGDKVFIENIETLSGSGIGFNSKNHGFEFFDVIDYTTGSNPGQVVLQIPELYGNPGVAVTFQVNTYATIVKSTDYPVFKASQDYGIFFKNEEIVIIDGDSTIETGLRVEKSAKNYIKLTGDYELDINQTIIGKSSGLRATIFDISKIGGIYTIAGSSTKDYGWTTDSGKLSIDTQVIPDNDYYQTLSYSIKSEKTWDEIKTPINSIVHPIGTKNFADTQIQKNVSGISTSGKARDSIVDNLQSFVSQSRVDTIKNFDMVVDYDPLENSSKFIQFKNVRLSDFFRSSTNRVLQIDDISGAFSSTDDNNTESFALLKDLTDKRYFYKFLVQVKSTDISQLAGDTHYQFSEVVALYDGREKVFFAEKSAYTNKTPYTTPELYGDIVAFADDTGKLNLRFDPADPFDVDYEIKILTEKYKSLSDGSTSQSYNSVDLLIDQVNVGIDTTIHPVRSFDLTESYDCFVIEAHILDRDSVTGNAKYYEIASLYKDSQLYTISEQNFDTSDTDISNIGIGTFGLEEVSDNLILTFYSDDYSNWCVKLKTYAFKDVSNGIGTYRFRSTRQPAGDERTVIINSSISNTGTNTGVVTTKSYDRNLFSTVKSLVRVSAGDTMSLHQIVSLHDDTNAFIVESPVVSIGDTMGIFDINLDNDNMHLEFERNSNYSDTDITITQLDTIFYEFLDEINLPNKLELSEYIQEQTVARYYGLNSPFRNRKNFTLKYNNNPIYAKTFDPYDTTVLPDPISGLFNIKDHFFSTGEELIYTPKSTFIGMGNSAMHVSGTNAGLSTEVYAIKINNDQFKLATTKENADAGTFISFDPNYLGEGNAHQIEMGKKNEKSLITINNLVQYPLLYTGIAHSISGSNIGIAQSFFTLSGISSVNPEDILKVDDEYMRVLNVGIGTSASGPILFFTGDLNIVEVERGAVGSAASTHDVDAEVDVYTGSYNIVGDEIFFTRAPRGNIGDLASFDQSNLPRERATFSGRTFLRLDYTTNEIFDDFSHQFDGVSDTFELTTLGLSTVGFSTADGNGLLFINGMFQTPLTQNITKHNFEILSDNTAGITTITFSGITTDTGEKFISIPDVNQNQLPRGGLIVSLGSTAGLGYAPLVGAKVRLDKDSNGGLTNVVSIASTGKTVAITTASYDNITGILEITSPQEEIYNLVQAKANLVKLVGLAFTCNSNPGITSEFPLHDDVTDIVGIGTTTFSLRVGISTLEHFYVGFGTVFVWHDGLNEGSGYRSETLAVSVKDAAEDYEHKFVRATSSAVVHTDPSLPIQFQDTEYQPTGATYDPTTGLLVLTIEDHGLDTNDRVQIATESITFTCSSDGHKFEIGYPRSTDPLAGIQTDIIATTTNTITVDAGSMVGSGGVVDVTVGAGGTLSFTVSAAGSNYTDPKLNISNPSYNNLSVEGITRGGVSTTDTGVNMLVNVEIGPSPGINTDGTVGIGSTLFEVSNFSISRQGYAFQRGDIMKVVGLVTDKSLSAPIEEFQLFVLDTYNDNVAAWQLGEMNIIDSILPYQNGKRKVFPLYYNSELLSFSKDLTNADSLRIDFSSLLVIFINGILQEPGEAYEFGGGSSFRFLTPPKTEDDVKIYFYVGTRGVDSIRIEVDETIQVGDVLQIQSNNVHLQDTVKQDIRMVFDIPNADVVETGLYLGDGINSEIEKPVDWIKQKEDIIVNQQTYYKSRDSLEPQIYPTAKVISGFSTSDTEIYLDNAELFDYEESVTLNNIDILLQDYQQDARVGIITAIVSAGGTISSFDIVNAGSGYTSSANIRVSNPILGIGTNRKWYSAGIGIGNTYPATVTGSVGIETTHILISDISNIQVGQIVSSIDSSILNGEPTVVAVSTVGIVTISSNTINTYPRESTFNFGTLSTGDVGIGTTAIASITITNGSISGVTVVNPGSGYTNTNPPQVVVDFPKANNELLKRANSVKHLNGSVIGIGTTSGLNGADLAFKFELTAPGDDFTDLTAGDPIYIFDTRIGTGITAIDSNDNDTVGLGTQFLDSVYKIQSLDTNTGIIVCNILSTTDISGEVGVGTTGTSLSPVGNYSWGKISGFIRSSNPVSIAVSSYTSSGLTTYPTIQRRGGSSGLRKTGALKKRTTST